MPLTLPPDIVITEIHDSVTNVTARADIYESDGTTLWYANAPIKAGNVSIDSSRDERRTASITLENTAGIFKSNPEGFWYDKVIKPFRGITYRDAAGNTQSWERQLGEFLIDNIVEPDFPRTVEVTVRDQTKKLLKAKFATSTEFPANEPIEEVIRAIAIAGGIPAGKITFPLTGKSTGRAFLFDRMTERWHAMKQISEAYNYDLYFRADGQLTMSAFQDPANPAVSPAEYTFQPGSGSNRVSNSGFEIPLSGNQARAAGWTYDYETESTAPTYTSTVTNPYRGDRVLGIVNSTGTTGGAVASKSIPVIAGEVWQIGHVARGSVATNRGRYLRVLFHNIEDGPRSPNISFVDLFADQPFPADWTAYSAQVTVPAGATYMRVVNYAWSTGVVYTGYFDSVSAVRLSPLDVNQGNIADFTRVTADERLYNHIVVTGESADTIPVTAQAENNNANSPTRIARIGRRTFFYSSAFITTQAQAQDVANRLLQTRALEQYEVDVQAIVVPYLEAPTIVNFIDPDPPTSGPTRFLLTNVEIPLGMGTMTANAKRVTIVS